ncbi:hypothetical protein [Frondihabitans sp. VKM Ac-2883]|uniref:hypothetical protein n=1 Tax=Frondihabitans sp. VKM Ac-2883 TaxID=2783823 RepID=UPI00188D6231|nr:hypothetical protein [Frondihabitans sp. VKM Ac-2883]MBF4575045.1 hypothetical protein [Frondihabitans sp. VKM Ac-2883]
MTSSLEAAHLWLRLDSYPLDPTPTRWIVVLLLFSVWLLALGRVTDPSPDRVAYSVFALSDLEGDTYQPLREAVRERLASFECARSPHLQEFARSKVKGWESHGHSRTYVLVCAAGDEGIDVPAFFTVGMTSIDFTKASSGIRKKLSGSISMLQTGAYTIAELARSDRFTGEQLPGSVILDEAKEIIRQSRALIAGRFLVVDAQVKVFESLYRPAGFKQLAIAEPPMGMPDEDFVTGCAVIRDW